MDSSQQTAFPNLANPLLPGSGQEAAPRVTDTPANTPRGRGPRQTASGPRARGSEASLRRCCDEREQGRERPGERLVQERQAWRQQQAWAVEGRKEAARPGPRTEDRATARWQVADYLGPRREFGGSSKCSEESLGDLNGGGYHLPF